MGGGGGDTTTTETKWEPPKVIQPYLQGALPHLGAWAMSETPQAWTGPRVADFTPTENLGMDLTTMRALGGSPTVQQGGNVLLDTLSGMNVYQNPYQESILQATQQYASPLANTDLGYAKAQRQFEDAIYTPERSYQTGAMQYAPTFAQADINDLLALESVGRTRQGAANQYIQEAMTNYLAPEQAMKERLATYLSLAYGTGQQGGTSSSEQIMPEQNKTMSAAGGALSGAASGYAMTGSPIGAVVGGILGALGGFA